MAEVAETMRAIAHMVAVDAPLCHSKRIAVIQRVVIDHFQLPADCMSSMIRRAQFVTGRHVAIYLARKLTRHTVEDIAAAFRADMDRSTVTHAINSTANRIATDAVFRATVDALETTARNEIASFDMPLFSFANHKKAVSQ